MDYKRLAIVFALFLGLSIFAIAFFTKKYNANTPKTPEIAQDFEERDNELTKDFSDVNKRLQAANERKDESEMLEETEDYISTEEDDLSEELLVDASLILSSVAHDIRVRVMSDEGIISGVNWVLKVVDENGNNYQVNDDDKDGLIHVYDVASGKYQIYLEPESGYRVSDEAVNLTVRDTVSYIAIPDISFEIKTEDQIDASIEDTAYSDEVDTGDSYERVLRGIKGIDVSKWNKVIDWEKVRADGVEYAIIRCGYRGSSTGALVIDPYWDINYKGARDAGVKVGVYFFTQALNEAEAVEEASMVVSLLGGESIDYPIFLDVESSGGRADILDNETRTRVINAFCATINSSGYKSGVYANKNWFTNKINTDKLDNNIIRWLAQYNVAGPTYDGKYDIWQYSSKGHVDGIDGFVDMDESYIK